LPVCDQLGHHTCVDVMHSQRLTNCRGPFETFVTFPLRRLMMSCWHSVLRNALTSLTNLEVLVSIIWNFLSSLLLITAFLILSVLLGARALLTHSLKPSKSVSCSCDQMMFTSQAGPLLCEALLRAHEHTPRGLTQTGEIQVQATA